MSTLKDISAQIGLVSGQELPANQNTIRLASAEPIALGRVHEATGPAQFSLALALASQVRGEIFWIAIGHRARITRARALEVYCTTNSITFVETASRDETLWASEVALRCRGAALVLIDIDKGPDLFESRRLQIAAQVGGAAGLVLIRRQAQSSGCETRWHCEPTVSSRADWLWTLTRARRGRPRTWSVRGDPPERLTHPPDLRPSLPSTFSPDPIDEPLHLTTHPRPLVSGPAA